MFIEMGEGNESDRKTKEEIISDIKTNVIKQLVKLYKNDSIKKIRIIQNKKWVVCSLLPTSSYIFLVFYNLNASIQKQPNIIIS